MTNSLARAQGIQDTPGFELALACRRGRDHHLSVFEAGLHHRLHQGARLDPTDVNRHTLNNQFYPGQRLSLAIGMASCRAAAQVEATLHEADQAMFREKACFYEEANMERRRT